MQYVFSMTSRMVTIALGCALLLGVLLFLLGMQIGARLTVDRPAPPQPMNSASWSAAVEPVRLRTVAAPAAAPGAAPGAGQASAQAAPAPATAGAADAANPDASSDSPDSPDTAATQPAAVAPVVVPAAADSGS